MIEMKFEPGNEKKLEQTFKKLIKEYGREAIDNPIIESLVDVAEPLESQIRTSTPRDTGKLASKTYSAGFIKYGRLYSAAGYKFSGKRDWPQAVAANILEHGGKTRNYPQRRTLQNVFDRNKGSFLSTFGESFTKKFEKLHKKFDKTKRIK